MFFFFFSFTRFSRKMNFFATFGQQNFLINGHVYSLFAAKRLVEVVGRIFIRFLWSKMIFGDRTWMEANGGNGLIPFFNPSKIFKFFVFVFVLSPFTFFFLIIFWTWLCIRKIYQVFIFYEFLQGKSRDD